MKLKKENIERIYCGNRNCPYIDCVRHNKNTPFNVQFLRENYSLDKNGECKYKLSDWRIDYVNKDYRN